MKALLDVNVLIALFDKDHSYHSIAADWLIDFCENPNNIWLSCAITQLGCVRIMSTPSYPNRQKIDDIRKKLSQFMSNTNHRFVLSDVDLTQSDLINWHHIQGHRQLTDVYLLALAKNNHASFVSLDNNIDPILIKSFDDKKLINLS